MAIEIRQYQPTKELQDELMTVFFKLERDAIERLGMPEGVARLLTCRLMYRFTHEIEKTVPEVTPKPGNDDKEGE